MRNTRRLEDKPLTEVYLHDSISLLRWKMFPKQSLKERFLHWKILPKAHFFPQFSICSPVMDAIVANDLFRSDKASQLQTSPNRHFGCCYNSRDASRDINQVPGIQKSSISLPGLVLKQNCHENVTKMSRKVQSRTVLLLSAARPSINLTFSCKVFYSSFFLRKTSTELKLF